MNTNLKSLLNEIEEHFYFLKKTKGDLEFVTFKRKTHDLSYDSLGTLYRLAFNIFDQRYSYAFLLSLEALNKFICSNGLITICFKEEEVLGFNFSKLEETDKDFLLIAGITLMGKHNHQFSLFELSNICLVSFSIDYAKQRGGNLFVSTVINDGLSLEQFHKMTGDSCYPFFETKISYDEKKLYVELAKLSFESYVIPNFPDSKFNKNDFVVKSKKEKMGFFDSFENIKHGKNLMYSFFIKTWLKDLANEDILFVGKLYNHEV